MVFTAEYENSLDNKFISGTSDNDDIYNHGQKVTINSGEGDDLIENGIYNYRYNTDNYASNTSINGGNGDDYVYNNLSQIHRLAAEQEMIT